MLSNRSIPRCTVIPELAYPDVTKAAEWLCDVFDFTLRLAIGDHRAQLNVGDGAVVVTERQMDSSSSDRTHSVLVRIEDVDRHHQHAGVGVPDDLGLVSHPGDGVGIRWSGDIGRAGQRAAPYISLHICISVPIY
jgi:hypothetical protein